MPLNAQEQRELDQLEFDKLSAEKAALSPARNTTSLKDQWARSSPIDRAKMLAGNFPGYAKEPALKAANAVANMGVRAAPPAIGQAAGAMTGPFAPAAVPILGAIGGMGGEAAAQMREGKMRPGAIIGAGVTGAIPGASLAGAGAGAIGREAGKQALGNMVAKTAQVGIDEGRLPTMGEAALAGGAAVAGTALASKLDKAANAVMAAEALKRSQDATRRQTIELGKELGYVLPPAVLRPTTGNNIINSIGGKAAMAQEAMLRNQQVTNKAVREEIGLPEHIALSPGSLNAARIGPNKVYGEVAAISPPAKIMLDDFKQAQADANALFSTYRSQFPKDPSVLAAAKQRQVDADDAVAMIEKEAATHKAGDVVDRFKEARIALAKIGLADRALNKGDGNIDAKIIGEAFDAGEKLTGNFQKIGRFQNAFSSALREASKVPPSGVNQLLPIMAGGAGVYGGMTHGVQGAAAALPFLAAPSMARELALSKFYQKDLMPTYGATRQDIPAMLARFGAPAAERSRNQFIDAEQRK
jgi:hypothetical protein